MVIHRFKIVLSLYICFSKNTEARSSALKSTDGSQASTCKELVGVERIVRKQIRIDQNFVYLHLPELRQRGH